MPHTIRLRGPWNFQPLARVILLADGSERRDESILPTGGVIVLPADWGGLLGAGFHGLVRFTRRFARPTGLDDRTRVWLIIEDVDWQARVTLNGHTLGQNQLKDSPPRPLALSPAPTCLPCPVRFDITALLAERNELALEILLPALAAGVPPLARPGREHLPGGPIGLVRLAIEEATG
jgi:hypothetical protein